MRENPDDWELEDNEMGVATPYPEFWVWILCFPVALIVLVVVWIRNLWRSRE